MSDKSKEILATFNKMVNLRKPLETYWRDAYNYSYPIRGQGFTTDNQDGFTNAQSAKAQQAKIYDSTATDSVRLLASSLISGLTPTNAQWFNLSIPNIPDANIPRDVRSWLQRSSETLFAMIHSSNYNAQGFEFFIDIAAGGQCGLYVERPDETGGLYFEHWPLYSLYCQDSLKQEGIDTVYRRVLMTAQEAVSKFGEKNLTSAISDEVKKNQYSTTQFAFIHCIRPRVAKGKQTAGKLAKNLPFESIYVCEKSEEIVYEGGYHEFPVVIPRWMVIPGTDYGLGPLNDALPDVKTLNHLKEMILQNAEMAIAGTFVARDDGILNPNTIRIGPRRVVFAADPDNIKPLSTGGNFNIANDLLVKLQSQIKRVMMSDELAPVERPQMTATEVQVRAQLVRQILGPTFARLQAEFLNPLIRRCFGLAYRSGDLGQPPQALAGFHFAPEYTSPLSRAQRLDEITAMDQFENSLAAMIRVSPEVVDLYDIDRAVQKRAELHGIPVELMRDVKEVEEVRQKRQQQQQQQAAMQAMQSLPQGAPQSDANQYA